MAQHGWGVMVVWFLILATGLVGFGVSLNAYLHRPSPSPSPPPPSPAAASPSAEPSPSAAAPSPAPVPSPFVPPEPGVYPVAPLPPAGLLCTFPAEAFETVNASCFPEPPDMPDAEYCVMLRDAETEYTCWRAACSSYLFYVNDDNYTYTTVSYDWEGEPNYSWITLLNDNVTFDGGPVRVLNLVQRFVEDNALDPPGPWNLPEAENPLVFTPADYVAETSFATDGREFARQLLVGMYNFDLIGDFNEHFHDPSDTTLNYYIEWARDYLIATPSRCPDQDFATIAWLIDDNITVGRMGVTFPYFGAINTSDPTIVSPENWYDTCMYYVAEDWFCDLWPRGIYSYESLTNTSVLPNPYRDISVIYRALGAEYADGCGEPVGCFGLIPPPTPTIPLNTTIRTFAPSAFNTLSMEWAPTPGSNIDEEECNNGRTLTNAVLLPMCTVLLSELADPNVTFTIGRVTLLSAEDFPDGASVRVVELLQQFMADNNDTGLPPQPMNETQVFDTSMYNETSFETSGGDFARYVAAALYSRNFNYRLARNASLLALVTANFDAQFYSPSALCLNTALLAIPWLRTYEALVTDAIDAANAMLGADLSAPDFQPENWLTACESVTGWPLFCDQFPDYYAIGSLYDFDAEPSPYGDLYTLMQVFVNEFPNGVQSTTHPCIAGPVLL